MANQALLDSVFSTDPELEAKVTDVIRLYLAPPENATVLNVDEKFQVQVLYRTEAWLQMRICDAEKRTHDCHRR